MQTYKPIPFLSSSVQAGFPSQADDYIEKTIDINDLFHVDEATSFYVRAVGLSMKDSGIMPADILCVRRDMDAKDGDIVIAVIDGECIVKIFRKRNTTIYFESSNEEFPNIFPESEQDVQIWGVVTGLARVLKK